MGGHPHAMTASGQFQQPDAGSSNMLTTGELEARSCTAVLCSWHSRFDGVACQGAARAAKHHALMSHAGGVPTDGLQRLLHAHLGCGKPARLCGGLWAHHAGRPAVCKPMVAWHPGAWLAIQQRGRTLCLPALKGTQNSAHTQLAPGLRQAACRAGWASLTVFT